MDRHLSKIFVRLPILPVVWLVISLLAPLMTRGGAAQREKGRLVYRLRPGMKVFSYWSIVISASILWLCSDEIRQGRLDAAVLTGSMGIAFLLGGFYFLSMHFFLDIDGLHYMRWFGKTTTILWKELDHYELRRDARTSSAQYFFRSTDGRSIPVSNFAHDAIGMVRRAKLNHPMGERPYKRRHWYGG